jgi:hypothetical protein
MKLILASLLASAMMIAPIAQATQYRSQAQVRLFHRTHVCPSTSAKTATCPGYVVDHIKALGCGGADRPYNMQYQTIAAGHAKDRVELIGCKK